MAMSDEDWAYVEDNLKTLWGRAFVLDCDGYRFGPRLEPLSTYKNVISVYVGGWFKGSWLLNDCEERRRFFRPSTRRAFSRKYAQSLKGTSKACLKRHKIDLEETFICYSFYWTSFSSLKRHLIRNNKDITLVKEDAC